MLPDEAELEKISKELQEKFPQKELGLRLLSAGILLPFGVFVVYFGEYLYGATLLGLCGILAWEYVRLWKGARYAREFVLFLSVLAAFFIANVLELFEVQWLYFAASAALLAAVSRNIFLIGGLIILGIFFYFGLEFRMSDTNGMAAIVLLCATAWGGDTGAYVAGRLFGGARIAPLISPKKTWSGLWGALFGAAFFSGLMAVFLSVPITLTLVFWAMGCAFIGACGDLFESWLKRVARVKDTSDLIPGHGGLLDRFDGLIAVVLLNGAVMWALKGTVSADILLQFLKG